MRTWFGKDGVYCLISGAVAVEAGVLDNFLWHEHYTWRDRTHAEKSAGMLQRLLRFHLTNGLLSLTGNVLLMRLLAGALHFPLFAANIISIITGSLATFPMSHNLAFLPQSDTPRPAVLTIP